MAVAGSMCRRSHFVHIQCDDDDDDVGRYVCECACVWIGIACVGAIDSTALSASSPSSSRTTPVRRCVRFVCVRARVPVGAR